MEVEFQASEESVEEIGYAIIDRANRLKKNGHEELALEMRTVGRQHIDHCRYDDTENEEKDFEESLIEDLK